MKLLAVVHKYPRTHNAGAEWMLHAMLRWAVERGHQATVAYPCQRSSTLDGVDIVPFDSAKKVDADIIITHLDMTPRAVALGKDRRLPVAHVVHNDSQLAFNRVNRSTADLVVWNSEWMAAAHPAWADTPSVIVRPPVIPTSDYEVEHPTLADGGTVTLVNVNAAKGGHVLWRLARILPDLRFVGVRGAYGAQIDKAPHAGIRNVQIVGHSADIARDVYAATGVVIMPSSYESWGRVAVEAACAGIPTVAAPTPGLTEALGDAGFFADRDDTDAWVVHLERLLDPAVYRAAAERAVARAGQLAEIAERDLRAWERACLAAIDAAPRQTGRVITSRSVRSRRCVVCGAARCACGSSTSSGATVVGAPPRSPGPLRVWTTAAGSWRLTDAAAAREGLLAVAGPMPAVLFRRVMRSARVDARAVYESASVPSRQVFCDRVAAMTDRELRAAGSEIVEPLRAGQVGSAVVETPADVTADVDGSGDVLPGPDARVGAVIAWVGDDPERAAQARRQELAPDGRGRRTVVDHCDRVMGD